MCIKYMWQEWWDAGEFVGDEQKTWRRFLLPTTNPWQMDPHGKASLCWSVGWVQQKQYAHHASNTLNGQTFVISAPHEYWSTLTIWSIFLIPSSKSHNLSFFLSINCLSFRKKYIFCSPLKYSQSGGKVFLNFGNHLVFPTKKYSAWSDIENSFQSLSCSTRI